MKPNPIGSGFNSSFGGFSESPNHVLNVFISHFFRDEEMNRISPDAGRTERNLTYGLHGGLSAGMSQLEHDLRPVLMDSVYHFTEAGNQIIGVNTRLMETRPAQNDPTYMSPGIYEPSLSLARLTYTLDQSVSHLPVVNRPCILAWQSGQNGFLLPSCCYYTA